MVKNRRVPDPPSADDLASTDNEPTAPLDTSAATSAEVRPVHPKRGGVSAGIEFGGYKLVRQLGVGGMGEVWEAEQREPLRRTVAVKIIKRGMDTAQVISRFEAERQALALMDHPAIARVFDAGETPEGRPFFAMELVRGIPLNQYCDQNRLSLQKRLELMIRVCEGVQHAHQKAVLHRDLKPSNILVTDHEADASPKIIDFGVAKATSQPLSEGTLFTELGQLIGTPEYMSPEQAELTGQGVDTRTDVYSLGVVLYQLLTGDLPFRTERLRSAGFDGIRRILREEDPKRPSTRVESAGDTATSIAERRQLDVTSLIRQLTGDLDWIVLKALEKDRTRRYGSPSELAADIRRYLDNQPIEARPASRSYRAKKFVQRHRVGVFTSLALLVLLLAFAASMAYLVGQLRTQRDLAADEARTAGTVSSFLAELFKSSDPEANRGGDVTARELLDRGAERISAELEDEPLVRARLELEIGKVYGSLGLFPEASSLLSKSLAERTALLGRAHADTLEAMKELGYIYYRQDRPTSLAPLQKELIELSQQTFGENHPKTIDARERSAASLSGEQPRLALEQFEAALKAWLVLEGKGEAALYDKRQALYGIAYGHYTLGEWEESVAAYRKVLAMDRAELGESSRDTLTTKRSLAWSLLRLGEEVEADMLLEEVLVGRTELLGPEHDGTLMSVLDKVGILSRKGDYEAAAELGADLVATRRRVSGRDSRWTTSSIYSQGHVLFALGRLEEARTAYAECVDIETNQGRKTTPATSRFRRSVIDVEVALGNLTMALEQVDEALAIERTVRAGGVIEGSLMTRRAEILVAKARLERGEGAKPLFEAAEAEARRAVALLTPKGELQLGFGKTVLAEALFELGRIEEARTELANGEELIRAFMPTFSPRFLRALSSRRQQIFGEG